MDQNSCKRMNRFGPNQGKVKMSQKGLMGGYFIITLYCLV